MDKKRPIDLDTPTGTPTKPAEKRAALENDSHAEVGREQSAAARQLDLVRADLRNEETPPRWFVHFFKDFEKRLDEKFTKKIEEVQEKVDAIDITVSNLEREVKELKKVRSSLEVKIDDLENRSRRCNLVYHGLPEKPGEKCQEAIESLLSDFVGVDMTAPGTAIERCHRTPATPRDDGKPRIIHVAFSTYSGKEKVRKACIEKFKSQKFQGNKLFVSDDFSRRVLSMRYEKMGKFKKLKDERKKPFFLYPARLAYRGGDGKLCIIDE